MEIKSLMKHRKAPIDVRTMLGSKWQKKVSYLKKGFIFITYGQSH